MARTSKLTQIKNAYNARIAALKAELAESRLSFLAHGERIYFAMLFILIMLAGIGVLIAWAAGAFDKSQEQQQEEEEIFVVCDDNKPCETGYNCVNNLCEVNKTCEGEQPLCKYCEDGVQKDRKNFLWKYRECWNAGIWAFWIIMAVLLFSVAAALIYFKVVRPGGRFLRRKIAEIDFPTLSGFFNSDESAAQELVNAGDLDYLGFEGQQYENLSPSEQKEAIQAYKEEKRATKRAATRRKFTMRRQNKISQVEPE